MLTDDRPDYPMTCAVHAQFAGTIRREAFSEAFDEVLARHPLLTALVDRSHPGRPCWMPGAVRPGIQWRESEDVTGFGLTDRIDLEREAGLRFQVRQDSEKAFATMLFHHVCSDGIGAARFLEELLAAYHVRVEPDCRADVLPATDLSRLPLRGCVPRMGSFPARVSHQVRTLVREGHHWLCHPVTPLGFPAGACEPGAGTLSLGRLPACEFDEDFSARLRAASKQRGVTMNDAFLAAMFATICEWNAGHPPAASTPWLRIAVPQNLREPADRWMPAANKVTMCFLTRSQHSCENASDLLRGIGVEMSAARYWLRGKSLLRAMRVAQAIPRLERRFREEDRCLATVVLSNLGDYDRWFCSSLPREGRHIRAGNVCLQRLTPAAPVRPQTHAAFCVASYGGVLRISMRPDPRVFTADKAEELLALFASKVESAAEG